MSRVVMLKPRPWIPCNKDEIGYMNLAYSTVSDIWDSSARKCIRYLMHFAIRFCILDQDSTSTQNVALFPLKTFKIPEINHLGLEP